MRNQKTLSIAALINMWLDAESVSFTALCGERVSHREVINTAVGTAAIMAAAAVGGAL